MFSLTSLGCLKLLGAAHGTLSFTIINSDIEGVETEGVQTRQPAVAVVPTEGQYQLLHVMGVVFVETALFPVVHLQDRVLYTVSRVPACHDWCPCQTACSVFYATLYPLRYPRINL